MMDFEKHRITVDELYSSACKRNTKIKVFSAYNGKKLCEKYNPKNIRHKSIGERIVCSIWPSFDWVKNYVYGTPADSLTPILCLSVVGDVEYQQALKERAANA